MSSSVSALMRFVQSHGTLPKSDSELLLDFAERGDQNAFAQLVERHGPLVLSVCRRIVRDGHEAEDAFQATFLLLSRRAASLRQPDRLGAWLHSVACRIARKTLHRYRRVVSLGPEHEQRLPVDANADAVRDLRPIMDEAILALPAKYREPVILHYLQGLTNAEVAHRLGCPLGTVATRLSRARDQLRLRLVRRGVGISAALFPALLSQAAAATRAPTDLFKLTVAQVAGPATATITQLIEGIGKTMLIEKSRWLVGAIVVMMACTVGVVSYHSVASEPAKAADAPGEAPKTDPAENALPVKAVAPKPNPLEPPIVVCETLPGNFVVTCAEARCAHLVAEMAELHRKRIAEQWLGKELPTWDQRCPIRVAITQERAHGATTMAFADNNIRLSMLLEGPLDRILADMLPKEVTHTVMATHFGKPVPRWVDEGIAIMSESAIEQTRQRRLARDFVKSSRILKLKNLLPMKDYAADSMVLLAQGYSLTNFLVQRKDRATLLGFVKDGMDGDWNKAAMKHYRFRDLDEMEEVWLKEVIGASAKAFDLQQRRLLGIPAGSAPRIGRAAPGGDDSEIFIGWAESYSIPSTKDGSEISFVSASPDAKATTCYGPATNKMSPLRRGRLYPVKEVKAFELDGAPIETAALFERLKKETAVLFSVTAKIDPFYLQLIKPGTMILVIPEQGAPPPFGSASN